MEENKDKDGILPPNTEPSGAQRSIGQKAINWLHDIVKGERLEIEKESPRYDRRNTSANKAKTSDGASRALQGLDES